jgi:TRAP transporter TAXI family solute receptor
LVQQERKDVGASVPVIAIIAILTAVALIASGVYLYRTLAEEVAHRPIVIATGPDSGAYHALGMALKRVLENTGEFSEVVILTTDGSTENMGLIGDPDGKVDLAFVQANASPATNARLITSLYDEVLHIMISTSDAATIKTIYDLEGANVSLGGAGSGTRELSQEVLKHFGVAVGNDLVMTPREAAAALADESIDAAFMLTALPSSLIADMAQRNNIRFITLGGAQELGDEAHALELVIPGVQRDIIPRSTYVRLPRQAIHTVSVTAMLVARENTEEELVRNITATVFGYRSGKSGLEGSELVVARKIRENYDPSAVLIPYHPGATGYYRREEPPFFVEYAESLSLVVTLLLGLFSIFIALREWLRRRMKNRVDGYLLEVESLAADVHTLAYDELIARQREMETLRRAAFADLVSERLLADEAFIILQNHLRDELAGVDARIAESSPGNKL